MFAMHCGNNVSHNNTLAFNDRNALNSTNPTIVKLICKAVNEASSLGYILVSLEILCRPVIHQKTYRGSNFHYTSSDDISVASSSHTLRIALRLQKEQHCLRFWNSTYLWPFSSMHLTSRLIIDYIKRVASQSADEQFKVFQQGDS